LPPAPPSPPLVQPAPPPTQPALPAIIVPPKFERSPMVRVWLSDASATPEISCAGPCRVVVFPDEQAKRHFRLAPAKAAVVIAARRHRADAVRAQQCRGLGKAYSDNRWAAPSRPKRCSKTCGAGKREKNRTGLSPIKSELRFLDVNLWFFYSTRWVREEIRGGLGSETVGSAATNTGFQTATLVFLSTSFASLAERTCSPAPDFLCNFDDQPQLCELLVFSQTVALG